MCSIRGRRTVSARLGIAAASVILLSGCWYQAGFEPGHSASNPLETILSKTSVSGLHQDGGYPFPPSASPAFTGTTAFDPIEYSDLPGHPPALVALTTPDLLTVKWKVALPGNPRAPAVGNPVIGGDGSVFITYTSVDGSLLSALSTATGVFQWTRPLVGNSPSAPTLAAAPTGTPGTGQLYVSTTNTVSEVGTGAALLATAVVPNVSTSVAVGNTLVYVGTSDGKLVALHRGSLLPAWSINVATTAMVDSPVVSGTTVYVAATDGLPLATFDATTGAPLASTAEPAPVIGSIAVGTGRVFVPVLLADGRTALLAQDATTLAIDWAYVDTTPGTGSGVIVANGIVYFFDGSVTDAVDASTGALLKQMLAGLQWHPPVVSDGHLFMPGLQLVAAGI